MHEFNLLSVLIQNWFSVLRSNVIYKSKAEAVVRLIQDPTILDMPKDHERVAYCNSCCECLSKVIDNQITSYQSKYKLPYPFCSIYKFVSLIFLLDCMM